MSPKATQLNLTQDEEKPEKQELKLFVVLF